MAFPAGDLLKVTWGGAMYTDRWQVGIWVSVTGMTSIPSATQMNTDATSSANVFTNDIWNAGSGLALKTLNASSVNYDICRQAMYRNGTLVQTGVANVTPVAGTGASPHAPGTSLVCSLYTAQAGPSFRGRVYFPFTAGPIAASNMQNSASMAGFMTNVQLWLQAFTTTDVNFPGTPALHAVVFSRTLGVTNNITRAVCDTKLDIIRRRQDKIAAAGTLSTTIT